MPEPDSTTLDTMAHDGETDEARGERLRVADLARVLQSLRPWQAQAVAEMARSGDHTMAARAGGSSLRTVERWRKADPAFGAAYSDAEWAHIHGIQSYVFAAAKSGKSDRLAEFVLSRRMREQYGEKLDVSVTGALAVAPLTPEQIADIVSRANPELLGRPAGGPQP